MIVLPIVDRELRVAARREATYRTRLLAAFAAMALVAWKCLDFSWQGASAASQGQSLFYILSGLAFAYCLCIGARVTSDCVSEEKREGTLGLLFLTDLKGLDVVLGKLVASSLNSFYGLLAVLPLLAIPLLLGGVTFEQFAHMVVVLMNALFFSVSAGIFVSAVSRNERKATLGTLLAVLGPALAPFCVLFFVTMVLEWVQNPSDLVPLLPWLMANPLYSYLISLPWPPLRFVAIPPWSFWASIGVVHVTGWVLLLITAKILPVVWRDRTPVVKQVAGPNLVERWRIWAQGNSAQRQALRTSLLERNPFLWLVSRDRLKPAYAWWFLLAMIGIWLWGYWQHREVMFDFYPLVPTLFLVHGVLKLWVISEVSHRLVEDQRNGAFELLLSTPLTMEEILRGQRLALLRQFCGPVLVLCALEVIVFQTAYPVRLILAVLIMLVADLFTLMWVVMKLSLTARSINEVLLKSVFFVLLLPWAVYLASWPAWDALWQYLFATEPRFRHRVYFWLAVGLLNNAVLILCWAQPQLLSKFSEGTAARWCSTALQLRQRWSAWRLKPKRSAGAM